MTRTKNVYQSVYFHLLVYEPLSAHFVNSLHSDLPSSGYKVAGSSNTNPYRTPGHLQVPEHQYSMTGYLADDPEQIDTNKSTNPGNMFSWITDINILTVIAEDILGPVIEESIKRKKGSQYPANRFPAKRKNKKKKYKDTGNVNESMKKGQRIKKYKIKKQKTTMKPNRTKGPASLVERLQNDLNNLVSAISMNIHPLDGKRTSFRNKLPNLPEMDSTSKGNIKRQIKPVSIYRLTQKL